MGVARSPLPTSSTTRIDVTMNVANISYLPADDAMGILDLTAGELLRQASFDEPTRTALIEVMPPGGVGMVDGTSGDVDRLVPGESLIVYTDGLPDAMDPSDVLFGEERLTTVLQSHHGMQPDQILDLVDMAIFDHTAPGRPADDVNIIVIQYPAN